MTHLRIEQNTTGIEEISSAVIKKLYDLVYSGTLDNTSDLQGRLHTISTYQSYVDYLTGQYPNLYIDATRLYIEFEDPITEQICATNWGDGVGLTMAQAQAVTGTIGTQFNGSNITTFNELRYFTNINSIEGFTNCRSLTSISIPPSVKTIQNATFYNDSNLQSIGDVQYLESIGTVQQFSGGSGSKLVFDPYQFKNLTDARIGCKFTNSTDWIVIDGTFTQVSINHSAIVKLEIKGNAQTVGSCDANTELEDIILPSTVTTITNSPFQYCRSLKTITIKATTPPTTGADLFYRARTPDHIYVPAESVSAYQSASWWSSYSSQISAIPS